jgi:hypothetical protein
LAGAAGAYFAPRAYCSEFIDLDYNVIDWHGMTFCDDNCRRRKGAFLRQAGRYLYTFFACLLARRGPCPPISVGEQSSWLACSLGCALILTFALVLVIGRVNVSYYSFEISRSYSQLRNLRCAHCGEIVVTVSGTAQQRRSQPVYIVTCRNTNARTV